MITMDPAALQTIDLDVSGSAILSPPNMPFWLPLRIYLDGIVVDVTDSFIFSQSMIYRHTCAPESSHAVVEVRLKVSQVAPCCLSIMWAFKTIQSLDEENSDVANHMLTSNP